MNGLALCAGVGGLELGCRLAIGAAYRTVCFVELDAFAAATLVARMEAAALDRAPIWDDLATFDGAPWRGVVDLVTAGFPCQPVSLAGKQRGTDDARWLWPDVARVVREVGPGRVFLENVPGLFAAGFGGVVGELAALGFDAEWDVFGAHHVGASHERDRVFILADAEHARQCRGRTPHHHHRRDAPGHDPDRCDPRVVFPPPPVDVAGWRAAIAADLPQPAVRGVVDGIPDRVDRLRCLGNGVVPLVAAHAYRVLDRRLSR